MQRFRGGLVFKAHRLVYHSTLGLGVIKKKKRAPSSSRRSTSAAAGGSSLEVLSGCIKDLGPGFQSLRLSIQGVSGCINLGGCGGVLVGGMTPPDLYLGVMKLSVVRIHELFFWR